MRFFSINQFVRELKEIYGNVEHMQLLLNVKTFKEDKYKNMVGPILMLKIFHDKKEEKLTYIQLKEKFGEDVRIKLNFPPENKLFFLILDINGIEAHSSFGPYFARSFFKVGYQTQKYAQKLTQDYEANAERIGDAIELVSGEDM